MPVDPAVVKRISLWVYEAASAFNIFYCITLSLAIKTSKNKSLPATYIYNMAISNALLVMFGIAVYILPYYMSDKTYKMYRDTIGPQISVGVTFLYLHPMLTLILMTINRIAVVLSMQASKLFTANKIWFYTSLHMIANFVCLLIPYLSECQINYDQRAVGFMSECAPKRHPITTFSNYYSVFFPFVAFFFNVLVIINFKLQRSPTYAKIKRILRGGKEDQFATTMPSDVLKAKKKTERMLMIQAFITAFYLSVYELTSLVLRVAPEIFSSLSLDGKMAFTYFRLAQIPCHVFLVYFIFTPVTRKIYLDFLRQRVFCMKPAKKTIKVSTTSTSTKK
ncbi:hypothetical protein B9Z55_010725 [Caenorhabditis nigoni]|nr:hypothetical protein B9Z55_010725 [Caenorhabditis nigoni]